MATVPLDAPYQPCPARFLELWEWQGWRGKVNGLSTQGEQPSRALIAAAKRIALQRLPLPARTDDHSGVDYLVIHDGDGLRFRLDGLVDRWRHRPVPRLWRTQGSPGAVALWVARGFRLLCVGDGRMLV